MGRPREVPTPKELEALRDKGMSYPEMARWLYHTTGQNFSPATLRSAAARAGLTVEQKRYDETIPWIVLTEHHNDLAMRRLRQLGKKNSGEPLSEVDETGLAGWLRRMDEFNLVIAYSERAFTDDAGKEWEAGFILLPRTDEPAGTYTTTKLPHPNAYHELRRKIPA